MPAGPHTPAGPRPRQRRTRTPPQCVHALVALGVQFPGTRMGHLGHRRRYQWRADHEVQVNVVGVQVVEPVAGAERHLQGAVIDQSAQRRVFELQVHWHLGSLEVAVAHVQQALTARAELAWPGGEHVERQCRSHAGLQGAEHLVIGLRQHLEVGVAVRRGTDALAKGNVQVLRGQHGGVEVTRRRAGALALASQPLGLVSVETQLHVQGHRIACRDDGFEHLANLVQLLWAQ